MAFSPDGKLVASADGDGTARLWDLATGRLYGPVLHADSGSGGGVNGVAFSPDGNCWPGRMLTVASSCGTRSRASMSARPWRRQRLNGVAFSPDGNCWPGRMLTVAPSCGTRSRASMSACPWRAGSSVNGVAFSPDGKLLAGADADGSVELWNPVTGQHVGSPLEAGSSVNGVAFSPDGKLLAGADADGSVHLWNTPTSQSGGLDSGDWLIIVACSAAFLASISAVLVTGGALGRIRWWKFQQED